MTRNNSTIEAEDKIRAALKELYGSEKRLIVRNTTKGVVSIGFGESPKDAAVGGKTIQRSNLPIVLTEELSPDVWLKSSDFRAAIAKGWLEIVSAEDYDNNMAAFRKRQEQLQKVAAKENFKGLVVGDARISQVPSNGEDISEYPMVIDEETASLKPANMDENARRFMAYEGLELPGRTPVTAEPGVTVIGTGVSSRAVSLVESTKRGTISPLEALSQLDNDEKLLENSDLEFISSSAGYDGVKSQARTFLSERLK